MAYESDSTYDGEILLFADHATDFGADPATPANSLIKGTPTDVQMDMGGLASGDKWQSAKFDFGDPWPSIWSLEACIEFAVAPTAGEGVGFWINFSPSATAGTGNKGYATGTDATYTDGIASLNQMFFVGFLTCQSNVLNIGDVGRSFRPTHRYASLIAWNTTSQAFATTADEIHVVLSPTAYVPGA